MALDEVWPEYAPDNYAAHSQSALDAASYDGHIYAITSLQPTYNSFGFIYRKDLAEGSDIWDGTMDDFQDVENYMLAVQNTGNDANLNEILDITSGSLTPVNLYASMMGMSAISSVRFLEIDPTEENPQISYLYDQEWIMDYLEMMNHWNQQGFFSKSALSITDTNQLNSGTAAIKIHNIDTYKDSAIANPDWSYGYANFVKNMSHQRQTQDCTVLPITCKNPERVMQFFELLYEDEEFFRAFYYGIEGTSYEITEDNQIKMLDPDTYTATAMWGSRMPQFMLDEAGTPADYREIQEGFEEQISEDPSAERLTAFAFDSEGYEAEIANISNIYTQYWAPLELGYTDATSGLEELKKQLEVAGIDKVRDAVQEQLDAYLASQE